MTNKTDLHHPLLLNDWPLFALAPSLPLILCTVILQCFYPVRPEQLVDAFVPAAKPGFGHLGDRLIYGAAAFIQLGTSVAVALFLILRIRRRDRRTRRGALWLFLISVFLVFFVSRLIYAFKAAPYQLTFNFNRQMLLQCPDGSEPYLFAAEGFLLGQSRMWWSTNFCFVLGIVSVSVIVSYCATIAAPDDVADSQWEVRFTERIGQLKTAFLLSSMLLVTSTAGIMLLLEMPAGVAEESLKPALSRYALGGTSFWGAVMTTTLLTTFGPPLLALRREAVRRHRDTKSEATFADWLAEREHLAVKPQLAGLAAMLAPILVGPVGALLQSVF